METPARGGNSNHRIFPSNGQPTKRRNIDCANPTRYDDDDLGTNNDMQKEITVKKLTEKTCLYAVFSKKFKTVRLLRFVDVISFIRRGTSHFSADTPFTEEITLIEMSGNFFFLNLKMYYRTSNHGNHVSHQK